MTHTDRLYDLLPIVYRMRDADQGFALRDYLRVLGAQADVLEADIEHLYENWFVETCDDWVLPYIGDLLGYRLLPEAATLTDPSECNTRLRQSIAPRRDIAATIASRRRKGTLSLIEDLALNAANWPARAVEFHRLLGRMQHLDHLRPALGTGTADLRRPDRLQCVPGAFDSFAHTVDARRITSARGRGRYGIPSVGLFVFRLRSYSVTTTPAYCIEERGAHCYSFSILGNDTPLFQRPVAESLPTQIAKERNLPVPLRRFRFAERGTDARYATVSADAYGEGKSVLIYAPDWPRKGEGMPVPREALIPANLSEWRYRVPRGRVAVDPASGRIVFPADQRPRHGVWVSYQYGFAADIGGGEYARPTVELDGAVRYYVHASLPKPLAIPPPLPTNHFMSINDALAAWSEAKDAAEKQAFEESRNAGRSEDDARREARSKRPRALLIELVESGVYEGRLELQLETGEAIQVRAANRTRPVLRLVDYRADRPDAISISGRRASRMIFDGVMVLGRGIEVQGRMSDEPQDPERSDDLCELVLRHCTLVPGWALQCGCDPKRPGEPSITLDSTRAAVRIEHSIVGAIMVIGPTPALEPQTLSICDSVVDATHVERVAIGSPDEAVAAVRASISRSTIIGQVHAHTIELAQDSIFASRVRVLRRQVGCMRFCYVPVSGSRTPRRFHCEPDDALGQIPASLDSYERRRQRDAVLSRVVPQFISLRYGSPSYARLDDTCCEEIAAGASNRSAMGVFNSLHEPQRRANLEVRIEEYGPGGADIGVIFAT